jgi:ABC-type molybdate transport system substrate-binding protein
VLERSGVLLGIANASIDPVGYNTIFALELEDQLLGGSAPSVYAHFFAGAPGAYARPNPTVTRTVPETEVATLLKTHAITASFVYRAYALTEGLPYVPLDPRVGLGAIDPASLAFYARASTTLLTATGPLVVHGAPVAFAATVPKNAPNAAAGALFVHLLLSPTGAQILASAGFAPVFPGWTDRPGAPPAPVAPDTAPLPATLAAQLMGG